MSILAAKRGTMMLRPSSGIADLTLFASSEVEICVQGTERSNRPRIKPATKIGIVAAEHERASNALCTPDGWRQATWPCYTHLGLWLQSLPSANPTEDT